MARPDSHDQSMDVKMRRLAIVSAFRLSLIWDLLTTFLGSLIILGNAGFIALGLSLVATLTVGALNFSTNAIWRRRRAPRAEITLLQLTWFFAIAFDFWTSLTCNTTYIALSQLNLGHSESLLQLFSRLTVGQMLIVLFVTLLATISPMMLSYIRDRDFDFLS